MAFSHSRDIPLLVFSPRQRLSSIPSLDHSLTLDEKLHLKTPETVMPDSDFLKHDWLEAKK